jgi:hypothetical protein
LVAENARLGREPHRAETERDILKKAAAAIVARSCRWGAVGPSPASGGATIACSSAGPSGDLRDRG